MKSLVETILSRKLHDPQVVIYTWFDEYGIKNYTINDKGEIDVDGRVVLTNNHLSEFPKYIQFNIVKRDFYCSHNELVSLRGCPREVGGKFDCSYNKLTTLESSPEKVGGDFDCHNNNLRDLKGAPEKVGDWFHCDNNRLTSLEGAPKEAKHFNCEKNTTKFSKKDVRKVCKVEKKILV